MAEFEQHQIAGNRRSPNRMRARAMMPAAHPGRSVPRPPASAPARRPPPAVLDGLTLTDPDLNREPPAAFQGPAGRNISPDMVQAMQAALQQNMANMNASPATSQPHMDQAALAAAMLANRARMGGGGGGMFTAS